MSDRETGGDSRQLDRGRAAAGRLAWDQAFELLSGADRASMTAADLELLATAAFLLGHVDTAIDSLSRAHLAYVGTKDAGGAVRCGFWVTFMLINRGDMAQAGGWIARCGRLLEHVPGEGVERGYMLALEGFRLAAIEHRYAEANATCDRVIEIGRQAGDEDLVALGLTTAGRALIRAGRADEGLARLDEAMVAVVSGALSPPVSGTVYCSLIEACEEISELRRAHEWTEALTRWCERQQGMITFTGQCLTHRATILGRRGHWESAAAELVRACEHFAGAADELATGRALYQLAEVHRVSGDLAAAEDAYRRAGEWGHDPQPGLALLRVAQGQTRAALAAMRRAVSETDDPIARVRLLPALVEVSLAGGDPTAAGEAADELSRLADVFGTDVLGAEAARARGLVALSAGKPRVALAQFRSACASWRSLEVPYEEARTRLLLGQACRDIGDDDTAGLELDAARRILDQLGIAPPPLAPSSAIPADRHGLTPRELEVLRLVATGITNQSVADELYVAVKTVDRHVANILTKLGVASRTAATAFAYQNGLI